MVCLFVLRTLRSEPKHRTGVVGERGSLQVCTQSEICNAACLRIRIQKRNCVRGVHASVCLRGVQDSGVHVTRTQSIPQSATVANARIFRWQRKLHHEFNFLCRFSSLPIDMPSTKTDCWPDSVSMAGFSRVSRDSGGPLGRAV